MKAKAFGIAGGSLMFLFFLPTAKATSIPQIDQSVLAPSFQSSLAVYAAQDLGQTFTVGLGGLLTQADLQLGRNSTTTQPLQLEIREITTGLPDESPGALLFSTTVPAAAVPVQIYSQSFSVSVDLSGAPPVVTQGEKLAIVLSCNVNNSGAGYNWTSYGYPNDIYPAGTGVVASGGSWSTLGGDNGFQTWVLVPEQTSSKLLLLGGLVLAGVRAKRKQCWS
jgi:hypothetical protein